MSLEGLRYSEPKSTINKSGQILKSIPINRKAEKVYLSLRRKYKKFTHEQFCTKIHRLRLLWQFVKLFGLLNSFDCQIVLLKQDNKDKFCIIIATVALIDSSIQSN